MASVTLDRVSKRYGPAAVVEDVTLAIEDHEFLVLVGPSGCGKSTTLRMIAGLEEASGGTIRIGARDVTRLEPRDRNIAMVFQNYALYPHKTIFENLAFGLRMRRLGSAEIERRVRGAAAMLGLSDMLGRRPRQLSGGQMQRVALGRALVREPDAFLLDEPLSNLDAKMRVQMREEIARLHAETRTSMIYVTHDQVEAMTLGDRICVMRSGRVQQVGPPLELYERPANRFVAGFIGSPEMNCLDGAVTAGPAFAAPGGLSLALDPARFDVPAPGAAATLGIRPEHLRIGPDGRGIAARVTLVEHLGAQTVIVTDVAGCRVAVLVPDAAAVVRGETLWLTPDPARIHLFDKESGLSLARMPRETSCRTDTLVPA